MSVKPSANPAKYVQVENVYYHVRMVSQIVVVTALIFRQTEHIVVNAVLSVNQVKSVQAENVCSVARKSRPTVAETV